MGAGICGRGGGGAGMCRRGRHRRRSVASAGTEGSALRGGGGDCGRDTCRGVAVDRWLRPPGGKRGRRLTVGAGTARAALGAAQRRRRRRGSPRLWRGGRRSAGRGMGMMERTELCSGNGEGGGRALWRPRIRQGRLSVAATAEAEMAALGGGSTDGDASAQRRRLRHVRPHGLERGRRSAGPAARGKARAASGGGGGGGGDGGRNVGGGRPGGRLGARRVRRRAERSGAAAGRPLDPECVGGGCGWARGGDQSARRLGGVCLTLSATRWPWGCGARQGARCVRRPKSIRGGR